MDSDRYRLRKWLAEGGPAEVIVIGASTGGPDAVTALLRNLPPGFPPIVLVQHINPALARSFADRLARNANLKLGDLRPGVLLRPGMLYVAHSDEHLGLRRGLNGAIVYIEQSEDLVSGHRPSIDYLFASAARFLSHTRIFAILMTGMGRDGAAGLKDLFDRGAFTVAQSEASCAVFGMPKEALRLGGVNLVGSPSEIRSWMEYAAGITKILKKAS